jgi:adenosine deaminase
MTDREWLTALPKVELHLHLEGAIPLDALWALIETYGGDASVPTPEALAARFAYRDFPHFIETWVWKNGYLRTYRDFTAIAEAVARDLASQNIRYVEAFYSPGDFARHGLEVGRLTEAIRKGLDRVPDVEVALVADLIRDFGPVAGLRTLDAVAEVRELGVVGIGIGGSEHAFPPEPWAEIYDRARALGFRTSAHAGEAAGAASVWGAVRALRVDRIGHGTRAVEDPALVEHLAASEVAVELCPISNVRTGVIGSLREHPARTFLEKGVRASVNTDDPKMFGTSLLEEFHGLMSALDFTRDDVRTLLEQAIEASWLPEQRRRALAESFRSDPAWSA